MSTLVLLYLGAGLFSAAIHYVVYAKEFDNNTLKKNYAKDFSHEMRVVLAIFVDVMTWPVALLVQIRKKNND